MDSLRKKLSLTAPQKRSGMINPCQAELDRFCELLKNKTHPPSDFSRLVYDYMDKCIAVDGIRKGMYSVIQFTETLRATTRMKSGWEMDFFHRSAWIEHATGPPLKLSDPEARSRWDDRLKEASPQERKNDGPAEEPIRLAFLTRDFLSGETEVAIEKAMQMAGKSQALKDMKQLDDGREQIMTGHVAFSAAPFKALGGDVGKSDHLGQKRALGWNAGSKTPLAALPEKFGNADMIADAKDKKPKFFNVDAERLKLRQSMLTVILDLEKKTSAVFETEANAREQMEAVKELAVPGLANFAEVLTRRSELVRLLALHAGADDGGAAALKVTLPGNDACDDEVLKISKVVTAVKTAQGHLKPNTAQDTTDTLAKSIVDIGPPHRVCLLLRQFGRTGSEFIEVVTLTSLEEMLRQLQTLELAAKAEFLLASQVNQYNAKRLPLPIPNLTCDSCSPLVSLQVDGDLASTLTSEDELSQAKATFTIASDQFQKIIKAMASAAKDVDMLISKKMRADVNAKAKEAQTESKMRQAAIMKEQKEAEKKSKRTNEG